MTRPVRQAVIGFLGLTALAVAVGLARRQGLVDADLARRASGVIVGLMAIVTGNFLPKLRPLGAAQNGVAAYAASERAAGWILLLSGVEFVLLFAFAPLRFARSMFPLVAFGSLFVIAADWIWVVLQARSRARRIAWDAGRPDARSEERRTISIWLLFGLAYVLVTAGFTFLADQATWARAVASWSVVAFTCAYAVLLVILDHGRKARPR